MTCAFGSGIGVVHPGCAPCAYRDCGVSLCTRLCPDAVVPAHGHECALGCTGFFCLPHLRRHAAETHERPPGSAFPQAVVAMGGAALAAGARLLGGRAPGAAGTEAVHDFLNAVAPGNEPLRGLVPWMPDDALPDERGWEAVREVRVRFSAPMLYARVLPRLAPLVARELVQAERAGARWARHPLLHGVRAWAVGRFARWLRGDLRDPGEVALRAWLPPTALPSAVARMRRSFRAGVPPASPYQVAEWLVAEPEKDDDVQAAAQPAGPVPVRVGPVATA